ncbi:MAG: hypothetical protein WAM71_19675 [Candidatus Korobacteraceae bacterium]
MGTLALLTPLSHRAGPAAFRETATLFNNKHQPQRSSERRKTMKVRWILGVLLLSACCGFAQTATRIDGRQHPELIPDNAAYRSVFMMQSHFETSEAAARSEQLQGNIGLSAADHQLYLQTLKNFRQQYETLINTHNAFVDTNTASASIADLQKEVSGTRQSVSRLVEATRGQLAAGLSKAGAARLDAFIQSEKTHMVVGVRSGQ